MLSRRFPLSQALLVTVLLTVVSIQISCAPKPPEPAKSSTTEKALAAANSACTLPDKMAASNEETAWQFFVAANCSLNGRLTWETWTEQSCWLEPSSPDCAPAGPGTLAVAPPIRRLHGSRLGAALTHDTAAAVAKSSLPNECDGKMNTAGPFAPKNLSGNPVFCEEVHVNPSESAFVTQPAPGQKITSVDAQAAYAAAKGAISFPVFAVEIKADWIPAASLAKPFDCANNKPAGVYVETIGTTCYALVGMHVSSKLLPNWLWATFEPQNAETNPNRCNPALYNSCSDPWGSSPATSTGQNTEATAALAALIKAAGLPEVFNNYRLVGAQTDYVDSANNPTKLGNSFVEFNAHVQPAKASCITCHSSAMILAGPPPLQKACCLQAIGKPPAPPAKSVSQDFSWMLGDMPAH
jgi:hypothetical protein